MWRCRPSKTSLVYFLIWPNALLSPRLKGPPLNIASSGLGLAITEMKSVLSNLFLDRCLIEYSGWRNRILISRNKGASVEPFNQRLSRHSKRGMQKIGATLESQEVKAHYFYTLYPLYVMSSAKAGTLPVTSTRHPLHLAHRLAQCMCSNCLDNR